VGSGRSLTRLRSENTFGYFYETKEAHVIAGSCGSRSFATFSLLLCGLCAVSCGAEKSPGYAENVAVGNRGGAAAQITIGSGGSTALGATRTASTSSGETGGGVVTTNTRSDICAEVHLQVSRVKPWIMFVVDRSGSTDEEYPGSTSKWQAMYDALMSPRTGVIDKLQNIAYFGILLFDGGEVIKTDACPDPNDCPDPIYITPDCPRLVTVNPALRNYDAINATYEQSPPGSSTPSAMALEAAYGLVPSEQQLDVDRDIGARFVIYCTDGEPNSCENGSAAIDPKARKAVVDQVTAAAQTGTKTYVISIAVNDNMRQHLTDVAKAGATGSSAFSPTSKDDLAKVITQIVSGSIGCNLKINNSVTPGKECLGYVELNSQPLTCNDPNGWKLTDPTHIKLLGTACDSFLYNPAAIVNAGFPCDVYVLE
jgi:hypothetical protein